MDEQAGSPFLAESAPASAGPADAGAAPPPPASAADTRGLLRKLGPAGILGIIWSATPAIMGGVLLYHIETVSQFLRQDPTLGYAGYICVFIISAGLGLLPTYSQSILGGWVFGLAAGLPGALAGFTGGAMVGYFTARTVSQDRVEQVIAARPNWAAVRDALVGGSFLKTLGIVTLVRLPPNSPFAITNLVLSTTGVRLLPYTLGTALGMLPRTAVAVGLAAAAHASAGDDGLAAFIKESKHSWMYLGAGIVLMLVVLAVIGQIANKAIARVTGQATERGGG